MRIEEEETEKRDRHLLGHVLKKEVRERFLLKHLKREADGVLKGNKDIAATNASLGISSVFGS